MTFKIYLKWWEKLKRREWKRKEGKYEAIQAFWDVGKLQESYEDSRLSYLKIGNGFTQLTVERSEKLQTEKCCRVISLRVDGLRWHRIKSASNENWLASIFVRLPPNFWPTFLWQKRLAVRCRSQSRLIEQPKKTEALCDQARGHRSGITAVKRLCLWALVFILLLRGLEV